MNHNFDTKIGTFFSKRAAGDVGLEVEVEFPDRTIPHNIIDPVYWVTKQDGSLRNGVEYVLQKPVSIKDLPKAIESFAQQTAGVKFSDSPRTSVHCHINMTRRTFGQLTNCLTAYYLFENVFVSANDPTRAGNLFCLRGKDAEWQTNQIARCIKRGWTFGTDQWGENHRYSALNLEALRRFGSIEFRFIEGTTDPKLIEFWAQTMFDFVDATSDISIDDQLQMVTSGPDGQHDFLHKVLTRPKDLLSRLRPDWPELVEENIPYGIAFRQAYLSAQRAIRFTPKRFALPVIYNTISDDLPNDKKLKKAIPTPPAFTIGQAVAAERELRERIRQNDAGRRRRRVPIPIPPDFPAPNVFAQAVIHEAATADVEAVQWANIAQNRLNEL